MSRRKLAKIKYIISNTQLNLNLLRFGFNLLKRGIYRLFPDRVDMPWPTTIMLELTNKCNLHCVTCPREYAYGKSLQLGEMPTWRAKAIIDQAYPDL